MSLLWFVLFGTKRTVEKLGYVADFCQFCRRTRSFAISRVGRANHLYFLSFGKGTLVGYLGECQACKVHTSLDPQLYQTIRKTLSLDLTELIQETFPKLEQYYQERLEIESRLARSPRSLPANIGVDSGYVQNSAKDS